MASNVIESEVVLFLLIDASSVAALQTRAHQAAYIVQARTRSLTDSGQEITNRVRMTARAGQPPEYSQCTKYLLPGNDMTQGQCVEIETPVVKEQYDAAVKFMNTISVKYRHSFRFRNVMIEIDHMVPYGKKGGGELIKVDIEGGRKDDIPDYLNRLRELGIRVTRNLTEEGIKAGKNIGGKLMSGPEYNHVQS
jgi:hypothetical protein